VTYVVRSWVRTVGGKKGEFLGNSANFVSRKAAQLYIREHEWAQEHVIYEIVDLDAPGPLIQGAVVRLRYNPAVIGTVAYVSPSIRDHVMVSWQDGLTDKRSMLELEVVG